MSVRGESWPRNAARTALPRRHGNRGLEAIEAVYRHEALTPRLIAALNPATDLVSLSNDVEEIGYPESDRRGKR